MRPERSRAMPPPSLHGTRRTPIVGIVLSALPVIGTLPLPWNPFDASATLDFVRELEAMGVDFIVLEDASLDTSGMPAGRGRLALEALTLASLLAVSTTRIGIVPIVNTNYLQPFAVARQIASLDHASHGRAGWLAVTDETGNAARNHSMENRAAAARETRREEFIEVVGKLFDSWEPGAFVRDKASGHFVDMARAHFLHHEGEAFQVKGPLNVAASPQGRPPLLRAIGPALASHPDCVMATATGVTPAATIEAGSSKPAPARLLRKVQPFVEATRADAQARRASRHAGHDSHESGCPDGSAVITGNWPDWDAFAGGLAGHPQFDGVLLSLPVHAARDIDHIRRLIAPLVAPPGAPDRAPAAVAPTLAARLGLQPAANRFTRTRTDAFSHA